MRPTEHTKSFKFLILLSCYHADVATAVLPTYMIAGNEKNENNPAAVMKRGQYQYGANTPSLDIKKQDNESGVSMAGPSSFQRTTLSQYEGFESMLRRPQRHKLIVRRRRLTKETPIMVPSDSLTRL